MTKEELEIIGINPNNIDKNYTRLGWDAYFMEIAFLVAKRSHDSNTNHGCVFVKDNVIYATGFNGFPPGSPDKILPNTRPKKMGFITHAEQAAILNCAKNGVALNGCKIYLTGLPCGNCARQLVSVGVKDWIVGPIGYQATEEDILLRKFWVENFDVKISHFSVEKPWFAILNSKNILKIKFE